MDRREAARHAVQAVRRHKLVVEYQWTGRDSDIADMAAEALAASVRLAAAILASYGDYVVNTPEEER